MLLMHSLVLRSNFLFLRDRSCLVFFNVQPTSGTSRQQSSEMVLNMWKWLLRLPALQSSSELRFCSRTVLWTIILTSHWFRCSEPHYSQYSSKGHTCTLWFIWHTGVRQMDLRCSTKHTKENSKCLIWFKSMQTWIFSYVFSKKQQLW